MNKQNDMILSVVSVLVGLMVTFLLIRKDLLNFKTKTKTNIKMMNRTKVTRQTNIKSDIDTLSIRMFKRKFGINTLDVV